MPGNGVIDGHERIREVVEAAVDGVEHAAHVLIVRKPTRTRWHAVAGGGGGGQAKGANGKVPRTPKEQALRRRSRNAILGTAGSVLLYLLATDSFARAEPEEQQEQEQEQ